MKRAYALLRKGRIFFQAYSLTTVGAIVAHGPVLVSEDEDESSLGAKAAQVVLASASGVPHPKDAAEWSRVQAPMLEAAAVKSWNMLAKGAKAISLEFVDGEVQIEPSSDYGKNSVVSHPERRISSSLDNEALGRAVIRAFGECDR